MVDKQVGRMQCVLVWQYNAVLLLLASSLLQNNSCEYEHWGSKRHWYVSTEVYWPDLEARPHDWCVASGIPDWYSTTISDLSHTNLSPVKNDASINSLESYFITISSDTLTWDTVIRLIMLTTADRFGVKINWYRPKWSSDTTTVQSCSIYHWLS